jgi:hypothetical protein
VESQLVLFQNGSRITTDLTWRHAQVVGRKAKYAKCGTDPFTKFPNQSKIEIQKSKMPLNAAAIKANTTAIAAYRRTLGVSFRIGI